MAKDIDALKIEIDTALRVAGGDATVRQLFLQHPEMLLEPCGVGTWLHKAALLGRLEMVETLVDLGIEVNTPKGITRDPPETAVYNAVTGGSIDVLRWLLERGGSSHCFVASEGGVYRNFALLEAVSHGRLDMVKLLVECGADVNVFYNQRTPLTYAGGHPKLAAYLRSVGARTPEELGLAELPPPKKSKKGNKK